MIITEKQIVLLLDILKDSLRGIQVQGQFSILYESRKELYLEIMNQQSEELKDIK